MESQKPELLDFWRDNTGLRRSFTMICPSEIEDQPLLLAYGAFAVGASYEGSFICKSIASALLYELEVRFKGKVRVHSPPKVRVEADGVGSGDFKAAIVRCLALRSTCRKMGYPRGEQFASELLELFKKNEQSRFSGGK